MEPSDGDDQGLEIHRKPKFVKLEHTTPLETFIEREEIDTQVLNPSTLPEQAEDLQREKISIKYFANKKHYFSTLKTSEPDNVIINVGEEEEISIQDNQAQDNQNDDDIFIYGDINQSCKYCNQTFKTVSPNL